MPYWFLVHLHVLFFVVPSGRAACTHALAVPPLARRAGRRLAPPSRPSLGIPLWGKCGVSYFNSVMCITPIAASAWNYTHTHSAIYLIRQAARVWPLNQMALGCLAVGPGRDRPSAQQRWELSQIRIHKPCIRAGPQWEDANGRTSRP